MTCRVTFRRAAVGCLAFALLLALVAGCGKGEENEGEPTPTTTILPATAADILAVDFSRVEEVRKLIDSIGGGEVLPGEVIFADLTGDDKPEAVVRIASGGTAGDVAYAVFAYRDGKLTALLTVRPETGRVQVAVEGGVLKETQPLYGPEDPLCCPSRLQNTYYRWDGQALAVDRQETVDNPTAKP